jgi:hypothetical protein
VVIRHRVGGLQETRGERRRPLAAHRCATARNGRVRGCAPVRELGATLAIGALLSVGRSYPWWSLASFFLCIYVIDGIFVYGDERVTRGT